MSFHVLSWVLRNSPTKLGDRLTLIALAEFAHDDGSKAFPMVETLQERTNLSERQQRECLKRLVAGKHIVRTGTTQRGVPIYRILMGGAESAGGAKSAPAESAERPAKSAPDTVNTQSGSSSSSKGRMPTQVGGAKVTPAEHDLVDGIMAALNAAWGTHFAGAEWRTKIVRRLREHSDVSLEQHVEIIHWQTAHPWWTGDPSPSVIYGNGGVFDRALNGVRGAAGGKKERTSGYTKPTNVKA